MSEPQGAALVGEPTAPSNVLFLLVLVIGLAAAAIWFVALPTLDKALATAPVKSSCEVVVVESGVSRCVKRTAPVTTKAPKRAKR